MIKAEDVKNEAYGKWRFILHNLAPALSEAIEKGPKRHVDCPNPIGHAHGGKNDFRLFKDYEETGGAICTCGTYADGISLLMWANGWDFKTTLHAVANELGMTEETSSRPRPKIDQSKLEEQRKKKLAEEAEDNAKLRAYLTRIWKSTVPATAPEAEPLRLYLARRGLSTTRIPNTLRFHPNLAYMTKGQEVLGYWPALIALVQDADGRPITLHRIYLTTEGGKAPVESPKKLMPYPTDRILRGSAIRLGPAGAALGVTEGLETGLAVQQATGMPVWATISAKLMENLDVPESVQQVCIYADKDKSETGRNSAAILVQKMWAEGRQAAGLLPTMAIPNAEKGIDWLDVLDRKGPEAIPNLTRVKQLMREAVGS